MRPIDADALSEKLCKTTVFIKDGEVFQRMINDAPTVSAEAVRDWIPCSERLPSKADHKDDMVLVCYGNGSIRFNTYMNGWVQGFPIAWMPLPTPYKGGDSE